MEIFHFIALRIRHSIRAYQTIGTEVIIGCIIRVEITTISIIHITFVIILTYTLIHKIPYKTSLELRIFTNHIPIMFETSHRITHRMSIFTLNQRFFRISLKIFFARAISGIHWAENICIVNTRILLEGFF